MLKARRRGHPDSFIPTAVVNWRHFQHHVECVNASFAGIGKILDRDWLYQRRDPCLIVWEMRTEDLSRVTALYTCWISFVFLNTVCLLSFWLRERRAGRIAAKNRVIQGIAFALIAALASTVALDSYAARISYYALAMSSKPLESIKPSRRRIVVEFIRDRAASSKAYQTAAAHFRPITPPLYSPQSFATVDAMEVTVQQLQQAFDLDAAYADRLKRSYARFCDEMSQADPQYLRAWQSDRNNEEQAETSLFSTEERWSQSVQRLYGYAASHHESIVLKDGELGFSLPQVRKQFEKLEDGSRDLQQKVETSRAAQVSKQHESAAEISN